MIDDFPGTVASGHLSHTGIIVSSDTLTWIVAWGTESSVKSRLDRGMEVTTPQTRLFDVLYYNSTPSILLG